jgi:hypothetical protein
VSFAVAVLAIFAALNSYGISARGYADPFAVARAEARFAPVLERVPPSAQLAYITDLDPSHPAWSAAFMAAQYALAPRQLLRVAGGNSPDLAVGNFSQPQDYGAVPGAQAYEVTSDLGNGVVLYQRRRSR